MDWVNVIVSILSGLCVCIPLVYKLVTTVISYVKEKNWNQIIMITTEYMITAETMFEAGAEKKSWVMEMLKASSKVSNFDLTEENLLKISELIDNMCALSKQINITK